MNTYHQIANSFELINEHYGKYHQMTREEWESLDEIKLFDIFEGISGKESFVIEFTFVEYDSEGEYDKVNIKTIVATYTSTRGTKWLGNCYDVQYLYENYEGVLYHVAECVEQGMTQGRSAAGSSYWKLLEHRIGDECVTHWF